MSDAAAPPHVAEPPAAGSVAFSDSDGPSAASLLSPRQLRSIHAVVQAQLLTVLGGAVPFSVTEEKGGERGAAEPPRQSSLAGEPAIDAAPAVATSEAGVSAAAGRFREDSASVLAMLPPLVGPWGAPASDSWQRRGLETDNPSMFGRPAGEEAAAGGGGAAVGGDVDGDGSVAALSLSTVELRHALRTYTVPLRISVTRAASSEPASAFEDEDPEAWEASYSTFHADSPVSGTEGCAADWRSDWQDWSHTSIDTPRKVFVAKLPLNVTPDEVVAAFAHMGLVVRVELWQGRADAVRRQLADNEGRQRRDRVTQVAWREKQKQKRSDATSAKGQPSPPAASLPSPPLPPSPAVPPASGSMISTAAAVSSLNEAPSQQQRGAGAARKGPDVAQPAAAAPPVVGSAIDLYAAWGGTACGGVSSTGVALRRFSTLLCRPPIVGSVLALLPPLRVAGPRLLHASPSAPADAGRAGSGAGALSLYPDADSVWGQKAAGPLKAAPARTKQQPKTKKHKDATAAAVAPAATAVRVAPGGAAKKKGASSSSSSGVSGSSGSGSSSSGAKKGKAAGGSAGGEDKSKRLWEQMLVSAGARIFVDSYA